MNYIMVLVIRIIRIELLHQSICVIEINKEFYSNYGKKYYNIEQTERDLVEQIARLNTREGRIHRVRAAMRLLRPDPRIIFFILKRKDLG